MLLALTFLVPGWGWGDHPWTRLRQWWPIDTDPFLPRFVQQLVCLVVAASLGVAGTVEIRRCLRRSSSSTQKSGV